MNFIPRPPRRHPSEFVRELSFSDLAGLRVTFINMPLRENARPNTPPQGPALLAARLRLYGAEANIVDLNAYRIKDTAAAARNADGIGRHLTYDEARGLLDRHFSKHGEPHIIGLSGMITTLRWQEEITRQCRALAPQSFIVSGGGLSTELKDGLFQWMPGLDAIADSEGDDIVLVLAKTVKDAMQGGVARRDRLLSETPFFVGLIHGRNRYVFGGDRPTNLDELPFAAWDLLEEDVDGERILEKYIEVPVWGLAANNSSATPFAMKRSLTTVSSRGCPYACAFCYRGAQGERNYGMRTAENIANEARWLVETYGVDFVGFPDDNFAVDKRRIAQLPDAFSGLGIRWGTHTRLDEADDRLDDMARSGCVYIGFGAESASSNTLQHMRKGGHILKRGTQRLNGYDMPTTMVEGIRKCRDVGIHANCTWIMGFPGETLEDLKVSVAFIKWQQELYTAGYIPGTQDYANQLASVNSRMFTATAYPGTEMFKLPSVREKLTQNFNISFDKAGHPLFDEAFRQYVLELDDATKLLHGKDGQPLNFGAMSDDRFIEARGYADQGKIEKILEM
jgi:radical SAM superfamily enzyme YgiQ (UPF0313 family)